jgi:uncharacterized protein
MTRARFSVSIAVAVIVTVLITLVAMREPIMSRIPPTWRISLAAWRHDVAVDHHVVMRARDGTPLAASMYRPAGATARLPTVLVRLPYHRLKYGEGLNAGLFFAAHGYAVLVQDLRGTGDSQGELMPWKHAAADGLDTLDWIVAQPWSNGKVGTFGCSALGETQLVLGVKNHPAHAAMIPSGAGGAVGSAAGRYAYFGVFEGGVFQLASGFGWFAENGAKSPSAPPAAPFDRAEVLRHLPSASLVRRVRSAPTGYDDYLATPLGDPLWREWGFLSDEDVSRVPSLVINTWGDQTVGDTLALAESWRRRGVPQRVVIAPGKHCDHEESGVTKHRFGELDVEGAHRPWRDWYLRWFDHWLRGLGNGLPELDAYQYFMLVENRWHASDRWPPSDSLQKRWYLDSDGLANSASGNGRLVASAPSTSRQDRFTYDPTHPVPSRGGPICCTGDRRDQAGPADQRDVEDRQDVLVYTSPPLEAEVRIAGRLRAHLWISSTASDTDLVARLVHVRPDGHATSIQEGALRLRYRESFEAPRQMRPGEVVGVNVDMRSIAYMVPRGHRLRLQVTSSSFPRLERNLNTGARNNALDAAPVVAVNTIYSGPERLSFVEYDALP